MAIVKLGEQRLWVEGDKAYSIDEVKSHHKELEIQKNNLTDELNTELHEIEVHTQNKAELEDKLGKVSSELDGVTLVLNRILDAENAPAKPKSEEVVIEEDAVVDGTEKLNDFSEQRMPLKSKVKVIF